MFLSDSVVIEGKSSSPSTSAWARLSGMASTKVCWRWPARWCIALVDRKIRGQSEAPRSLPSAAVVLKVITKFPGAIAYIPEHELSPEVQAVTIDGVGHKQPGIRFCNSRCHVCRAQQRQRPRGFFIHADFVFESLKRQLPPAPPAPSRRPRPPGAAAPAESR